MQHQYLVEDAKKRAVTEISPKIWIAHQKFTKNLSETPKSARKSGFGEKFFEEHYF
jgi:hypothetical protein